MIKLVRENSYGDSTNYRKQYVDFINTVDRLAEKYGIDMTVHAERVQPRQDFGSAGIVLSYDGKDIARIDYFFDYGIDPDYPDRDWFITFNMRNYVFDKIERFDFHDHDEALAFLKGFFPKIVKSVNKYGVPD